MISLNNEPCCICGDTRSQLAWETSYPEHGYPGSFQLRRCQACGLLFNSPRLEPDELSDLYGRSYYFFNRPDAREFARAVPMYRRSVALVANDTPEKRSLDIGGGRGYLPALLKKLGWITHSVELSHNASAYAREKFGVNVFTGTIEQFVQAPDHAVFPLVTAIDVIEHVPDPVGFVRAASAAVAPGGRLIVDTPNAAAKNIRIEGITWQGFNPFHIFLFNPDNLARLLTDAGLTIEKRFSYGNAMADRHSRSRIHRIGRTAREHLPGWVLGPMAKAWFAIRGMSRQKGTTEEHLAKAATDATAPGNYLDTPDARQQFAADLTGDNLVIIARKPA
ncbi:MAG: class I SAM-dependent methyltransferase [Phycisphaerae bacterium]|nr:class I SAM-dependent methyltransferase [Phycisphaerae bacterium]